MKRDEPEQSPMHGAAKKKRAEDIKCAELEPSRLPALEVNGQLMGLSSNLPAPAPLTSREFTRSRTWGRRRRRAWVRRTSRLNAN